MTRHELLAIMAAFHEHDGGWPDKPMLGRVVKANRRYFGSTYDGQLSQTLAACLRIGYLAELGCDHCGLTRIELTKAGRAALDDMNEHGCKGHWLRNGRTSCNLTDYELTPAA